MIRRSLAWVGVAVCSGCSQGDDPVFIALEGDVSDAWSGLPIGEAEVLVRDALDHETPTRTDAEGHWELTVVLAGAQPLPVEIEVAHEDFVGTTYHYAVRLPPESDGRMELRPGTAETPLALRVPGVPLASKSEYPGTITGHVFDATVDRDASAEPWFINGLELTLREGMRSLEGEPVASVTSGQILSGEFTAEGGFILEEIPAGTYTLAVTGGDSYSDAFITVVSLGGQIRSEQNIGTAAAIGPEDFRFVLSWGATPSDLDSHLWGRNPEASDGLPFHIYFPEPSRFAPYGDTSSPFATLDVDDVSSFGPETVTLEDRVRGRYRYYVHDFSNRELASSLAMSQSAAKVQVWSGSEYDSFDITPGVDATVWHVADIDGPNGWIYFVNDFEHEADPNLVGDLTDDG